MKTPSASTSEPLEHIFYRQILDQLIQLPSTLIIRLDKRIRIQSILSGNDELMGKPASDCIGLNMLSWLHPCDRKPLIRLVLDSIVHHRESLQVINRIFNAQRQPHTILWTLMFHYTELSQLSIIDAIGIEIAPAQMDPVQPSPQTVPVEPNPSIPYSRGDDQDQQSGQRLNRILAKENMNQAQWIRIQAEYKISPVPSFTWQKSGDDFYLIDYNDAAYELTEGKIDRVLGIASRNYNSDDPFFRKALFECYEKQEVIRLESPYTLRLTRKNLIIAFRFNFVSPDMVVVHAVDITLRKTAEEALRKSELKYRILLDNIPQHVFYKDVNSVYQAVNPAFANSFSLKPSDFIGKSDYDFFPADLAARYRDDDQRIMNSRQADEFDDIIEVESEKLYIHSIRSPVIDDQNKVIGILGIFWDTTREKQSEQALRNSEERYRLLAEYSSDIISKLDPEGTYRYVSPACRHLLGYTPEEMQDRNCLDFIHPDDSKQIMDILQSGHSDSTITISFRVKKKIGDYVWFETIMRSIRDPLQNSIVEYMAVSRDISERKINEVLLQRAKEDAEEANKAKGDFLATISHEIRTPMNAIIGIGQLLDKTPLDPYQKDYLNKILTSGQALLEMINEILDYSKIEAGKMELDNHPFSLDDLLLSVANVIGFQVEEKGLELLYYINSDIPEFIVGDFNKLNQILINLCGNAVKFTEKGQVILIIDPVSQTQDSIELRFTIRDTGIGITEQQLNHLFQPFSQADSSTSRRYGGTGLGLAISKRMVELMGGIIRVESRFGEGSLFTFTLRFGVTRLANESSAAITDLRSLRILLIDLVLDSNRSLPALLNELKAEVILCTNLSQLHDLIYLSPQADPGQLILIHTEAGHPSLPDLFRILHSRIRTARIPKIIVSPQTDPLAWSPILPNGRTITIINPSFQPGELLELVSLYQKSIRWNRAFTLSPSTLPDHRSRIDGTSRNRLKGILLELESLLKRSTIQTDDYFKSVQPELSLFIMPQDMELLEKLIQRYDFDQALSIINPWLVDLSDRQE
ncbi:MAG: PAS domain S-box protein [Candidatus Delongbacteria bacterium]|nr:PAS domain S-box protein [Candidatus Delongbacteria bacterium]